VVITHYLGTNPALVKVAVDDGCLPAAPDMTDY
jgi:hypothetical protein